MLPRRFRSSALRASGAGRLATDRFGHLARRTVLAVVRVAAPITEFGVGSCPQFVVMATVAPSSLGVAVNNMAFAILGGVFIVLPRRVITLLMEAFGSDRQLRQLSGCQDAAYPTSRRRIDRFRPVWPSMR